MWSSPPLTVQWQLTQQCWTDLLATRSCLVFVPTTSRRQPVRPEAPIGRRGYRSWRLSRVRRSHRTHQSHRRGLPPLFIHASFPLSDSRLCTGAAGRRGWNQRCTQRRRVDRLAVALPILHAADPLRHPSHVHQRHRRGLHPCSCAQLPFLVSLVPVQEGQEGQEGYNGISGAHSARAWAVSRWLS